jgi:hypothetical protein
VCKAAHQLKPPGPGEGEGRAEEGRKALCVPRPLELRMGWRWRSGTENGSVAVGRRLGVVYGIGERCTGFEDVEDAESFGI